VFGSVGGLVIFSGGQNATTCLDAMYRVQTSFKLILRLGISKDRNLAL